MNAHSITDKSGIHKAISPAAADLMQDAFEEGRQGYSAAARNPHNRGSVLFHVWNIGHDAANLEHDALTASLDARF